MKISLLILCLAVVYGTCRIYNEENVDVVEEIQNNGNYKDYANVPFQRLLARHKRSNLLIIKAIEILNLFTNGIISTVVNMFKILTGQIKCTKEEIFINNILPLVLHPLETLQFATCNFLDVIGQQGRALITKMIDIISNFITMIILPLMHTMLNNLNSTGLLPRQLKILIQIFNFIYRYLQITGTVPT